MLLQQSHLNKQLLRRDITNSDKDIYANIKVWTGW